MKKLAYILILMAVVLSSCNDYETYGDKKEKERNAISKFIADSSFTIISEEEFVKNGYKTNLERREFVKLDKSGVYMQIVRPGCPRLPLHRVRHPQRLYDDLQYDGKLCVHARPHSCHTYREHLYRQFPQRVHGQCLQQYDRPCRLSRSPHIHQGRPSTVDGRRVRQGAPHRAPHSGPRHCLVVCEPLFLHDHTTA